MNYLKLNNGINIPIIGLGTANPSYGIYKKKIRNEIIKKIYYYGFEKIYINQKYIKSITNAIKFGYRLLDTSAAYSNEKLIG